MHAEVTPSVAETVLRPPQHDVFTEQLDCEWASAVQFRDARDRVPVLNQYRVVDQRDTKLGRPIGYARISDLLANADAGYARLSGSFSQLGSWDGGFASLV